MTDKSELNERGIAAAATALGFEFVKSNEWSRQAAEIAIRAYLAIAPQAPVSAVPVAYRFSDGGGYNADWRYSTYDPREYDHVVEESGASCLGSVTPLYASPPPPAQAPVSALDNPARVGSVIFRKGTSVAMVIEAAQRNYQHHAAILPSPPPPAQADDGKGLTGLDRLRLHVTDPDTFSVGYDDIDDALKEIDECLSAYVPLIRELVAALDKASYNVRSANLVHEITDLLDRAKAAGYSS